MTIVGEVTRLRMVRGGCAIVATIMLILGCSTSENAKSAFPPPKLPPGEEQKRQYRAEQGLQATFEREMRKRGRQLRAEIAARPRKQTGSMVQATRCGEYFLYYDYDFMNGAHKQLYLSCALRHANIPVGFTVSYTPPDAEVDWIDEVETGTYNVAIRDTSGLYVYSRGRKIPRGKVVPVPFYDSKWYYDKIYIRGVPYGEGEAYAYVE